jgi:hypothetical protein
VKTLLTIFTLVFTVMFSSTSFGGWTKVVKNVDGDTFYVDFERIRKVDGYVYYWELMDYLKPNSGVMSVKSYKQGDCKLFRLKFRSQRLFVQPMGDGVGQMVNLTIKDWIYPVPDTGNEVILKSVCSR